MTHEFCPHCNKLRNLIVSRSLKITKDKNGKEIRKIIHSYHCESCNSFIRSEEAHARRVEA